MSAAWLMAKLPLDYYLDIGPVEPDDETETTIILGATLMHRVPEDGWEDGPDRYRFDDRAISAITAIDEEAFERLLGWMLKDHIRGITGEIVP